MHVVRGKIFLSGFVLLLIAGGLMAADLVIKELPHSKELAMQETGEGNGDTGGMMSSSSALSSSDASMMPSSSDTSAVPSSVSSAMSSSKKVVKKGTSTKKSEGVNVQEIFGSLQLAPTVSGEAGFLFFTVKDRSKVQTVVLLKNNDRAFLFSWIESDEVKTMFGALKQALSEQFSGKLQGLVDETQYPEGGPPVDVLSFYDPALSPEKITFLRVRNRLYEIHTSKNGEALLPALLESLSR